MNPNVTIRPWLLACGAQYGIRQAHEYRWADAQTVQREMYCTYRSLEGISENGCILDLSTGSNTTYVVGVAGCEGFIQQWQIDLYNSEDGLYELESFCVAANHVPAIRKIFDDQGCTFAGLVRVTNESKYDDAEIYYHHRLICNFRENVEISISDIDGYVSQIDLGVFDDDPTSSITRSGIEIL